MGPAIISITLLDLLNYINKETVIVKMDVESYECKILFQYLTHPHPSYYLPYIMMEWRHLTACPHLHHLITMMTSDYVPYSLPSGYQMVPGSLKQTNKKRLLMEEDHPDVLWAHRDAVPLFWR